MEKVQITRRMLMKGIQGRIKVRECDKFNKEIDKLNEIKLIEPQEKDLEDIQILKEPKLRKVRSYRGWD